MRAESPRALHDIVVECFAFIVEWMPLGPAFLRRCPIQCRPTPDGVQRVFHDVQRRLIDDKLVAKPLAVLEVLALQLAVVLGVTRRSLKQQDAVTFEH